MSTEPKTSTKTPAIPEVLRFDRTEGFVGEHFVTFVHPEIKEAFRAINCRVSWQRNRPDDIAKNASRHHHPVSRTMLAEMVGEDRADELLKNVYTDGEGNITMSDMVLCARHNDAHDVEQERWANIAKRREGAQDATDDFLGDVAEVISRLRSEGVPVDPPNMDDLRSLAKIPDAGDFVHVDKNPV